MQKENPLFLFISECQVSSVKPKLLKTSEMQKENPLFLLFQSRKAFSSKKLCIFAVAKAKELEP